GGLFTVARNEGNRGAFIEEADSDLHLLVRAAPGFRRRWFEECGRRQRSFLLHTSRFGAAAAMSGSSVLLVNRKGRSQPAPIRRGDHASYTLGWRNRAGGRRE